MSILQTCHNGDVVIAVYAAVTTICGPVLRPDDHRYFVQIARTRNRIVSAAVSVIA
jgi:hypothetical protein